MALAVTHIILTIITLDFFRHYVFKKDKFPRYLLVIGGIAGLLPDIDIPFSWIYNFFTNSQASFHGLYTHSLFFPIIFLTIGGILHYKKNLIWAKIFYVISAGFFAHLLLDCAFGGYKSFIWPLTSIGSSCPKWDSSPYASGIDAIILVAWLIHEELHKKIRDYF